MLWFQLTQESVNARHNDSVVDVPCNVMLNPAEEEHFLPVDITIPPVHGMQRHVYKHTNHIYFMSITTHAV